MLVFEPKIKCTVSILKFKKNNISIHINFYQTRFINECVKKIKAKIPESHSFTILVFFFVRCRRTYVVIKKSAKMSNKDINKELTIRGKTTLIRQILLIFNNEFKILVFS